MKIECINKDLVVTDDVKIEKDVEIEKVTIEYSLDFKTYQLKFKVGLN